MDASSSSSARVLTSMPNFDYLFDDTILPVLPPLQDLASNSTGRASWPPALEPRPNGRVNRETQTTSTPLSSRQRALAQAKPIEDGESIEIDPRLLKPSGKHEDSGEQAQEVIPAPPDPEQARKKAKLRHNEQIADFVHLPKPQAPKPRKDRLPPIRPIADLNELPQPPPTGARFPPITPRSTQFKESLETQEQAKLPTLLPRPETPKSSRRASRKPAPPKRARVYTRERLKWTEEETDQLVKGITIFGTGRWKHILDHPDLTFEPSRTHVDLKDRFRVVFPTNEPEKWTRPMPEHISEDEASAAAGEPKPRLRKRKKQWTEAEDDELDRGFAIYGYKWELMAKDPLLDFDNRTGTQIRDRFRLKYPERWADRGPALPTPPPKLPQGRPKGAVTKGEKRRAKKNSDEGRWETEAKASERPEGGALENISGKVVTASKTTVNTMSGQGQDWLNEVLNEAEAETRWSNALNQYDWGGIGAGEDNLTLPPVLPPLRWEDMTPNTPLFDIG